MAHGLARRLFSRVTLRQALFVSAGTACDPLVALGTLIPEPALRELEAERLAVWEAMAAIRDAPTAATDLGPPGPAEVQAAQRAAESSSEDPPLVQRWLRALDELTEAVTQASVPPAEGGELAPAQLLARCPRYVAGYVVEGELARGGMGVVYRARDPALDRAVAIKLMRGADLASDADLRRFEVEAQAAAGLRHPGIVAVHASGITEQGAPYLVLDLIEGPSLGDLLGEGPLAPRRAARLTREVALALAHAHEAGVLHRDLKPANILLDGDERALLTDFGLAKRVDLDEGLTHSGQILGTPSYMAPEQAEGAGALLDVRTDVYGLGATLYDLLTGRPPFRGVGTWQVVSAVLSEEAPDPCALRPEIDRSLSAICLRCLEKDPERRYPSAVALARDLERYLADEPVEAQPLSLRRRVMRRLRRVRSKLIGVGALLALALAAGLGLELQQASKVRGYLDQAHRQARLGAPAKQVEQAVGEAIALSPTLETRLEGARALRAAGLGSGADALLEEAVRAHPPGIEALLALHQAEVAKGPFRFTAALDRALAAARAQGTGEGRAAALGNYAEAEAVLAEDPGAALPLLDRAIELAPRYGWSYVARASAYEALGRSEEALADLSAALVIDPRNFVALCNRGSILRAGGYLSAARAEFEAAEQLDPHSDHPAFLLGALALEARDYEEAKRAFQRAAALSGPHAGEALAWSAECARQLGQPGAGALATQAIAAGVRGEALARAHYLRALESSPAAALAELDAALAAWPELVPALLARAPLQASLSDMEGDYSSALSLDPSNSQALRGRARARVAGGDRRGALEDLGRALGVDPGDGEAYLIRADLSVLEGRSEAALRDYGNAIRARPEDPEPWIRRGVLWARLGEQGPAGEDWREALRLLQPSEVEARARVEAWLQRLSKR